MQYHFHSPSEHSIDGKLLDLEMHVVHAMENQYTGEDKPENSQFSNGVLGFLFRTMPDSYFAEVKKKDPKCEIGFHDQFLSDMVDTEMAKTDGKQQPLDMTKFVALLNYNRRWTY